MLRLHTVLAVDRAGLVGEDGETHHGVFDVGFLRQAQGLQILCPATTAELKDMLTWAVRECSGPVAVRYPRGGDGALTASFWDATTPVVRHRTGSDGVIVTYGTLVNGAMAAADLLAERGIHVSVLRLTSINPIPAAELEIALSGQKHVLIVEEAICGIAESLAWHLTSRTPDAKISTVDLGRNYVTHGSADALYKHYGLDPVSMADKFMEVRKVEK